MKYAINKLINTDKKKIFDILKELDSNSHKNIVYYKGICVKRFSDNYYKILDTTEVHYTEIKNRITIKLILRRLIKFKKHHKRIVVIYKIRELKQKQEWSNVTKSRMKYYKDKQLTK